MWLNDEKVSDTSIIKYQDSLKRYCPKHIVIDGLFSNTKLDEVMPVLQQTQHWQSQKHTYSALYVDNEQWEHTAKDQRFVQRDIWQRDSENTALEFLKYLRGKEFLSLLSRIFNVILTDKNVSNPNINTNYFRLGADDFVEQHADDPPGREVCMLLYLNKNWHENLGDDLCFLGNKENPIKIAPQFNRSVLFAPSSEGSEHWVDKINSKHSHQYRYNLTSWYWSE